MRVVVLSREKALPDRLAECCPPGVQCVHAPSGYEAAAEILAAPADALVIDLRAMSAAHRRLLDIARQMNVDTLGVGVLPAGMSSEDLSGVRLVSQADLGEALARLAPVPDATAREAGEFAPAARGAPAAGDKRAPAEAPARPRKKTLAVPEANPAAQPPPTPAEGPRGLLTPEEISALLERNP